MSMDHYKRVLQAGQGWTSGSRQDRTGKEQLRASGRLHYSGRGAPTALIYAAGRILLLSGDGEGQARVPGSLPF